MVLETNRQVELPPSLTMLGDGPIRRISHVRDMLFHALPGERMRIEVERDGQPVPAFNLEVEPLRDAPPSAAESSPTPETGGTEPSAIERLSEPPPSDREPPLSR
jgi:hypothetical protein